MFSTDVNVTVVKLLIPLNVKPSSMVVIFSPISISVNCGITIAWKRLVSKISLEPYSTLNFVYCCVLLNAVASTTKLAPV